MLRDLEGDKRTLKHTGETCLINVEIEEKRPSNLDIENDLIHKQWLDNCLKKLETKDDKRAVVLKCVYNYRNADIARELSVSPARITQRFKRIGEKIWKCYK